MNETPSTDTSQPEPATFEPPMEVLHSCKRGRVNCDVGRATDGSGDYAVTFYRWFKNKNDEWTKAHLLYKGAKNDDLTDMLTAATEAASWIEHQRANQ